ncbi:hypothetical protein LINPERPRIM_LOCUS30114 [Linum perenne]
MPHVLSTALTLAIRISCCGVQLGCPRLLEIKLNSNISLLTKDEVALFLSLVGITNLLVSRLLLAKDLD